MAEYLYKGFKVHYEIKPVFNSDLYQASASVHCDREEKSQRLTQKFQTSSSSKQIAQQEIKKIIHNYIDFEWKEFLEMQGENRLPE